jgi:hypothetical protein
MNSLSATLTAIFCILALLTGCSPKRSAVIFSDIIAYESQGTGHSQLTGVITNATDRGIKMISIRPRLYGANEEKLPYWPDWLEHSIYMVIPAGASVPFTTTRNDLSKYRKQPEVQRIEIDVRQIFYE